MRQIRYPALLLVLLFLFACGSEDPPEETPQTVDTDSFPEIVARVNGEEVTRAELLNRAKAFARLQGEAPNDVESYRQLLDELVSSLLLYQESVRQGLAPGDEELDARLETIRKRFPSESHFAEVLKEQGLTPESMKEALRRDLAVKRLLEQEDGEETEVEEEDIRKFFEENRDRFRRPDRLRVSHILAMVAKGSPESAYEDARRKIEDLREEIEGGADFAELAREHSGDPGSASRGGDLGWMTRGVMVPAFERAAYALETGELSPPVRTPFGYHLLVLKEREKGELVSFEETRDSIEKHLQDVATQRQLGERVDALKKDAQIEVLL